MQPLVGSVKTIPMPIPCPSEAEIAAAVKLLNDQAVAVYQALYVNGLSMAGGGGQFRVERDCSSIGVTVLVTVTPNSREHSAYAFRTRTPKGVLEKVRLIEAAIRQGRMKRDLRACCPLAEFRSCVCTVSFLCPLHGERCHGTHD